jgi:hypothetical protein
MNISVYKGDDKSFGLEVTDQDNEIINLSGGELLFNVTDWQSTLKFSKSSTDPTQIEITDAEAGLADIHILPADTAGMDPDIYVVYIKFTNSEGKLYTISEGEFQVLDLGTLAYMRNRIRNFQGDKVELNVLIRALETTDEELNDYMKKSIDYFNAVGYTTTYVLSDFPNKGVLIDGTVIQILMGKGILSARNMLTYQDTGGVTVQDFDVYGRYVNLFNIYINKYMQQVMDVKTSINIDGAYGSIESPMNYLDIWN